MGGVRDSSDAPPIPIPIPRTPHNASQTPTFGYLFAKKKCQKPLPASVREPEPQRRTSGVSPLLLSGQMLEERSGVLQRALAACTQAERELSMAEVPSPIRGVGVGVEWPQNASPIPLISPPPMKTTVTILLCSITDAPRPLPGAGAGDAGAAAAPAGAPGAAAAPRARAAARAPGVPGREEGGICGDDISTAVFLGGGARVWGRGLRRFMYNEWGFFLMRELMRWRNHTRFNAARSHALKNPSAGFRHPQECNANAASKF